MDKRVVALSNLSGVHPYVPSGFARDDVLHRFAQTIRRISWGATKEVWFLVDDYSATVIPNLAQQAYNPVLFRASTELRIKLSSEGEGPSLTDSLGRKYREGRELTKVNLGEVYFAAGEHQGREFFESILEARFKETGKGSLEQLKSLLGEHPNEENFGGYILSRARPGLARFHGLGIICSLCSGDVSFVIELLNNITQGKWEGSATRIKPTEQDEIIKQFCQRQLAELRNIADFGGALYTFAFNLGESIKAHLLRSEDPSRPDERLRIEIEGTGDLSPEALRMHEALLRNSVLVSGGTGKSKRGLPTKKLYFRRMFAPCFPFSTHRRGCIDVSFVEYEKWLSDPSSINAGRKPKSDNPELF